MLSIASTSKLPFIPIITLRQTRSIPVNLNRSFCSSTNLLNNSTTKIQTVLFECDQETASKRLTMAAASAFGMSSVFKLLAIRFSKTFLGSSFGLEEPLKELAIRPMLLPYFKVDLSLNGRIIIGEDNEMQISVTVQDATFPGFSLSPLHELNLNSLADSETIPFDEKIHLHQQNQSISLVPFSVSPLSLLKKLAAYPRPRDAGVSFNPANFKSNMFAMYPLYLPIYLAEYLDTADDRRVTCVAFANQASPGFAIFPSFLEEKRWIPNGTGVEISIAGTPVDRTNPTSVTPGALGKLKPQLDNLMEKNFLVDFCTPTTIEELEINPRVLSYSEFQKSNKEYINASLALMAGESNLKFAEAMPDEAKTVVLSRQGLKVQDVKKMKDGLKTAVEKLKVKRETALPQWLKELNEAESSTK